MPVSSLHGAGDIRSYDKGCVPGMSGVRTMAGEGMCRAWGTCCSSKLLLSWDLQWDGS